MIFKKDIKKNILRNGWEEDDIILDEGILDG